MAANGHGMEVHDVPAVPLHAVPLEDYAIAHDSDLSRVGPVNGHHLCAGARSVRRLRWIQGQYGQVNGKLSLIAPGIVPQMSRVFQSPENSAMIAHYPYLSIVGGSGVVDRVIAGIDHIQVVEGDLLPLFHRRLA